MHGGESAWVGLLDFAKDFQTRCTVFMVWAVVQTWEVEVKTLLGPWKRVFRRGGWWGVDLSAGRPSETTRSVESWKQWAFTRTQTCSGPVHCRDGVKRAVNHGRASPLPRCSLGTKHCSSVSHAHRGWGSRSQRLCWMQIKPLPDAKKLPRVRTSGQS